MRKDDKTEISVEVAVHLKLATFVSLLFYFNVNVKSNLHY